MEWLELLYKLVEVCLIPLLGILTAYAVKFIKIKGDEIAVKLNNEKANKYIALVSQTITDCVIATNQTYVEALKKDNAFSADAQKAAFQMTYDAVMAVLTDDAKDYIVAIYGDLSAYIATKIEAEVNLNK
jgi:hypothetical protein